MTFLQVVVMVVVSVSSSQTQNVPIKSRFVKAYNNFTQEKNKEIILLWISSSTNCYCQTKQEGISIEINWNN